jgi:phenylalanyl-tRNA synthetase beta chain
VRVPLSWLREFVDLPESVEALREALDDLGLVVEGIERVGEGLEDVVVARVDEIRSIKGADRIRLVVVDAGDGPLEIVCGATNFEVGQHVPLAPVGAVLPGGFEIARRQMRGVTSHGMLCSPRELGLADDHRGLMILDSLGATLPGQPLIEALGLEADVVFDISVEGNRPDAWCIEGVARDLAVRFGRELRTPRVEAPSSGDPTSAAASAGIDAPDLCGRLTVSVLRGVVVGPSPAWVSHRLEAAGMRAISNVVDASNLVMLELGQPTHPYDAARVAGRELRARRARSGESLTTLDGVERSLAQPGRGLGDTGEDCVIVDGADTVLGLAGIMGGATSEIDDTTTEVLLEAAFFDPMAVARSSKRHGLRTEASARFERGVDPALALRAVGRFVAILRESVPDLEWLADPLDVRGVLPASSVVTLRPGDVERSLGESVDDVEVTRLLSGLGFDVMPTVEGLEVTAPSARLDVREGAEGRADVIEEIARLHGYTRLPRRTPTWPQPGGLSDRQRVRRRVRDTLVDLGVVEAWTATLVDDEAIDLLAPGAPRVRITNPLALDESVLRTGMLVGLLRAWGRNEERGLGDVALGEIGVVFAHPDATGSPRRTRGGVGGATTLALPQEEERITVVLGREGDGASTALALFAALARRLGLAEVVARGPVDQPGVHPTRSAHLVDEASGLSLGVVGEVDPDLVEAVAPTARGRRVGLLDLSLEALADPARATRRSETASQPSRYPSAVVDLAFVAPSDLHAADLARALRRASGLVESVELFDVYRGPGVAEGARSLAYRVRFSAADHTLSESELAGARAALIESGQGLGAVLR